MAGLATYPQIFHQDRRGAMRHCVLVSSTLALMLPCFTVAHAECKIDRDCAIGLLCDEGKCVYPPPATQPEKKPPSSDLQPRKVEWASTTDQRERSSFRTSVMKFRPHHIAELKRTGAFLDQIDADIADSLGKRGYTAGDFVAGYKEYLALRDTYEEFETFSRHMLETVIVAQKLSLTEYGRAWFVWQRHETNMGLTKFYNKELIGGKNHKWAGLILVGVGATALIVGGIIFGLHDVFDDGTRAIAGIVGVTGAGIIIGSTPGLIYGLYRTSKWLPDGFLENENINKLHTRADSTSSTRLTFSPTLGPTGTGLGMHVTF